MGSTPQKKKCPNPCQSWGKSGMKQSFACAKIARTLRCCHPCYSLRFLWWSVGKPDPDIRHIFHAGCPRRFLFGRANFLAQGGLSVIAWFHQLAGRKSEPPSKPITLVESALSARGYNGPPMALTPGSRLGPYEIQSAIGAGGMGEVYRARDTRLNRIVAIKVSNEQ